MQHGQIQGIKSLRPKVFRHDSRGSTSFYGREPRACSVPPEINPK